VNFDSLRLFDQCGLLHCHGQGPSALCVQWPSVHRMMGRYHILEARRVRVALNPNPSNLKQGATGVTRDSLHYDESVRKLNKHVFKCVRSSVSEREENCCVFVIHWVSTRVGYSKNRFLCIVSIECDCYCGSEILDGHEKTQHLSPDRLLPLT
jgi:hypothetical protein